MTLPRTPVTADEFWETYAGRDFPRYELVKGELVEIASLGGFMAESQQTL